MPKLPVIKGADMIRALKKLGFYEHNQTGSHLQLKHLDGRRTTIPAHQGKDIPRGTLGAIMKQAKISLLDLMKNL